MTAVRRRLARRVEEAFLAQHGIAVTVDPNAISFPEGFYRTDHRADCYRWTASCVKVGLKVGPTVDCYDTATECGRNGITLDQRKWFAWEATAKEPPPSPTPSKRDEGE